MRPQVHFMRLSAILVDVALLVRDEVVAYLCHKDMRKLHLIDDMTRVLWAEDAHEGLNVIRILQ